METQNYLLPNQFKKVGWFLFTLTSLFTIYYFSQDQEPHFLNLKVFAFVTDEIMGNGMSYFTIINDNIGNEIIGFFGILGCLFIAFSKEKCEDELVAKVRLDSLLWATYINYFILMGAILFIYSMPFFWILVFNMYTTLIVFIIRFNWMSYNLKKSISDEK
ncbi:hypothetical protein [Aureispira sp. CCB-QB1]|uniref:hypothetical protein n=1 Tax=Aureispira sp. CCB-QB1 TaxID=1313421 RepID=UPI0006962D9C|nr:hypothetical protein [Aureispira sp. CCB-QB1]